jgi:riboflavin kinase
MKFTGHVTSGIGHGAQFLALDWVALQLRQLLGTTVFPGTLNLRVASEIRDALFSRRKTMPRIADSASSDCPGYLLHVALRTSGRSFDSAYVILPEKTVYKDVLEVIAPVNLRERLALEDGAAVEVETKLE